MSLLLGKCLFLASFDAFRNLLSFSDFFVENLDRKFSTFNFLNFFLEEIPLCMLANSG